MTRIAIIAGTYLPASDGIAHYTARLCAALSQYSVQSMILTTYYAAEAAYDPNAIGVVHGWRLADLRTLARAVQDTNADILHIEYATCNYGVESAIILLPLVLRATGWKAPIVTTVHEYGSCPFTPRSIEAVVKWLKMLGQRQNWRDRSDGFLLTLSDAVIATTSDNVALIHQRLPKLQRLFHIPTAANVEVAPIDRAIALSLLRQTCSWPLDALVIAFFGFLHPFKGLETLLPAFKQVLATQPQARLLIIGGVENLVLRGEDAKRYWVQLHALVAELGLLQMVHFTGYASAETVSHYLAGADIGVLPFNDGLTQKSSSLLTLLAHGLPVVATQHISLSNLPDRNPVQLVPPCDIDALAVGLLDLLNKPDERLQLGEAGRAFTQNFSWQAVAQAHLDVYQTVLNKTKLQSKG